MGSGMENPNTIYYGYQVNAGPDGKPHVREFGNVRPTKRGTFELGTREPFVDTVVDDKENVLKVVAEMPGIQKEDISLEVTEKNLSIKAVNKERNYSTEVPLNVPVDTTSAKALVQQRNPRSQAETQRDTKVARRQCQGRVDEKSLRATTRGFFYFSKISGGNRLW